MAKVDKTMTAMVQTVRKDGTGFMITETDGKDLWFRLGQRSEGCPDKGMVVRIDYNVSPGNEEYPNDTYWANAWTETRNGGTPTSEPNPYDTQAQRIEQQEEAERRLTAADAFPSSHEKPIRRFETNDSISMAVCIRWVTEAQLGNLAAAVSQPDVDAMAMTITAESIAKHAEELYQRVFVYGPTPDVNPPPAQQDASPWPEHPSG